LTPGVERNTVDEELQEDTIAQIGSQEEPQEADASTVVEDAVVDAGSEEESQSNTEGPTEGEGGSLTDGHEEVTQQNDEPEEVDWRERYEELNSSYERDQKRLKGLKTAHDRIAYEQRQMREKYGDVPLDDAVEAYKTKMASVPVYNPKHPDHQRFMSSTLPMMGIFREQVSRARSDEERTRIAEMWEGKFSPDDLEAVKAYESHQQDFQRRLAIDPRGALRDILQEEMGQFTQQRTLETEVRSKSESLVNDNWELIQPRHDDFMAKMQQGVDPEVLIQNYKLEAEMESLRARVLEADRQSASVSEQARLAKGRATNTQDVQPAQAVDVWDLAVKEAAKIGIKPSDPQFNQVLTQVEQSL
jgi:hypothetical protein